MSLARRALRAVPPLRSWLFRHRARREAARIDPARPGTVPVLVYQMGKVGSSTAVRSLSGCGRRVLSVHFLVPEEIEASKAWRREVGGDTGAVSILCLGEALGARIAELGDRVRFPVVTLVRDPIAREVSGLFQTAHLQQGVLYGQDGCVVADAALDFLADRFAGDAPCDYGERWFDRELQRTFGIDVFAAPFDTRRGYAILRSARADVLVLRTEDLDRTLPVGAAELLGLSQPPSVLRANERDLTPDGEAYARVQKAFRLPRSRVEQIYAGRLARHFYSPDEIAGFVERWSAQ
jgi:hypothetical protein